MCLLRYGLINPLQRLPSNILPTERRQARVRALQVNSSAYVDPLAQTGRGGREDGIIVLSLLAIIYVLYNGILAIIAVNMSRYVVS